MYEKEQLSPQYKRFKLKNRDIHNRLEKGEQGEGMERPKTKKKRQLREPKCVA